MAAARIAKACMTYLELPMTSTSTELDSLMESYPFLLYSAKYWGVHVAASANDSTVAYRSRSLLRNTVALKRGVDAISLKDEEDRVTPLAYLHSASHLFTDASAACVAAYFGLVQSFKQLIHDEGQEIVATTCSRGRTPLHYAATQGHTMMVSFLLMHKAQVNARDSHGVTPLHLAAYKGAHEVLDLLLREDADVAATTTYWDVDWDQTHSQPLHWAAQNPSDDPYPTEALLRKGANIEAFNPWNRTPLHLAARHGLPTIMESLLRKGADIEKTRDGGATPLIWTVELNRVTATKVLLKHGANINTSSALGTPLEFALYHDDRVIWNLLFRKDLDALNFAMTQAVTRKNFNNSGKKALVELWTIAAELMSELTNQPRQNCVDDIRNRLLVESMHLPNFRAFAFLIEVGADIRQTDQHDRSIMHMSLHWNRFDIFQQGLSEGLDFRSRDKQGCEPIHHAASSGCIQAVQWLLGEGVKVDTADELKWTALHWASYHGQSEVACYLLENGCSREAVDVEGRTALDLVLHVRPADAKLIAVLEETPTPIIADHLLDKTFAETSRYFLCSGWMSIWTWGLYKPALQEVCDLQWDANLGNFMQVLCDFEYGTCCNERWALTEAASLREGLLMYKSFLENLIGPPAFPVYKLAFCSTCFYVSCLPKLLEHISFDIVSPQLAQDFAALQILPSISACAATPIKRGLGIATSNFAIYSGFRLSNLATSSGCSLPDFAKH